MAEATPAPKSKSFFDRVNDWFKSASEWVQTHLGDPGLSTVLRQDLGLNPDPNVVVKSQRFPHVKNLDPNKKAFDETVKELTEIIQTAIAFGDEIKSGGVDGWDAFFMISEIAAASSLRANVPAVYALGKLLNMVSSDPESYESLGMGVLGQLLSGKGFDENAGDTAVRVLIESSYILVLGLHWLLHDKLDLPVELGCSYGWDPAPNSPTPVADQASSAVTTISIGHAGDSAAFTFAPMTREFGGPAVMLGFGGRVTLPPTTTDSPLRLEVNADAGITLFMPLRGGDPKFKAIVNNPSANLKLIYHHEPADGPAFRFGGATGTRFEARSMDVGLIVNGGGAGFSFGLKDAALYVGVGEDGFLGQLQKGELKIGADVGFTLSTNGGFKLDGGSALHVSLPIATTIGGIFTIFSLELDLGGGANGADLGITFSGGFSLKLGPFKASVDRMGMRADMKFSRGNLGPLNLKLGFKPPNGIGMVVDAAIVKGGGYLGIDTEHGQYAGALELKIAVIGLKALGVISTKMPDGSEGWSFLLLIYFDFPPIQLSFGFVLSGAGGMIGLQHSMDLQAVRSGLSTGILNDVLFPKDPVADAPRLIKSILTIFPPTRYALTFGPMFELGWGTPLIVALRLGLIVDLDNALGGDRPLSLSKIVLIGVLTADLPFRNDSHLSILHLEVDFDGYWDLDNKRIGFDAELRNSKIIALVELFGGLSIYMDYGDHPDFILSAGGFFPGYNKLPTGFKAPPRLGFSVQFSPIVKIRLEAYFAVTAATVQTGAKLEVWYGVDAANVHGMLSFDALIEFSPFHFRVEAHATLEVNVAGMTLCGISFSGSLEGPGLWKLDGEAKIHILFWDIPVGVHTSWGQADATPPAITQVQPLLVNAMTTPGNWSALPPAGTESMVTLGPPAGDTTPLAHPLGALCFTQKVVPFGLKLQKFGTSNVGGPDQFDLSEAHVGGKPIGSPQRLNEMFARSQYLNIPSERRLTEAEFEPMPAGVRFGSTQMSFSSSVVTTDIGFDTLDYDDTSVRLTHRLLGAHLSVQAQFGAVARGSLAEALKIKAAPERIAQTGIIVNPPRFAVADTQTMQAVAAVQLKPAAVTSFSLASQTLHAAGAAGQIVEAFELAE